MSKYDDVRSMGKSKIVPFDPNEDAKTRHRRRINTNLQYWENLADWCETNGWIPEIKNDNHHWIFRKNNFMVEWWPSTAKLIVNKNWENGIHCHDYQQVIKKLSRLDAKPK